MTSTSDPLVGQLLDRRYRIEDRIARGGMATVYRATDTRLGRLVALKVMHVGLGDDADFARKFDREARAAARLSHSHVVSVFDQGSDGDRPYIVMELVDGHTLRNVISAEAPLAPLRALSLLEPVLAALAAAHEAGLVHRDIKPENVLISERGQIKVGDFGLARAVTAQTSTATAGLLIGTVSYLPPELVLTGKADARSDIYSAGVVLFEMLTGRKPHTGDSPIQVAYAHVHNDVAAPSSLPTAGPIPDYLDALVARATARNADARPHDAQVLLAQVRRVRSAITSGLEADPELSQDLTVPLQQLRRDPGPAAAGREDYGSEPDQPADDPWAATTAIGPATAPQAAPSGYLDAGAGPDTAEQQHNDEHTEAELTPTDIRFLSRPSTPSSPTTTELEAVADPRPVPAHRAVHRNPHRLRGWIALIIVLLLTVLAGAIGWYWTKGRFTTTPALTSLSRAEATTVAAESGLDLQFRQGYSETVPEGAVIATAPKPGGKVPRGGEVDAVVSQGPERYPMPKVVGNKRQGAVSTLTEARLAVGNVNQTYSENVEKGRVISTSEKPGSQLKPNTRVDLKVSKGRQPIKITDYTGENAGTAAEELKQAGFSVEVSQQHSAEVAEGAVIEQSPSDGTGHRDDTIELVASQGPVMVSVPNVKSMGVDAAKEALQEKGFRVQTASSEVLDLGLGYVASTDPGADTSVAKGSLITVYLV